MNCYSHISITLNLVSPKGVKTRMSRQHLQSITFHIVAEYCIRDSTLPRVMKITRLRSVTLFFTNSALDSHNLLRSICRGRTREIRDGIKSNALKAGKRDAFKLYACPSRFICYFRNTRFRIKSTSWESKIWNIKYTYVNICHFCANP